MKILKNRTILGIACIVLSLFICFGLTPMFNEAVSSKVSVVRLTKDVAVGDEITSSMLRTVEVGGYNLPNDIIKNRENIVGKYVTVDMKKSDYILPSKLSDVPIAEYGYLDDFTGDKRAISVTLRTFASGLSGKLQMGDIVSVYVADYGNEKETLSPIELKYIKVLAVTLGTGYDTNQNETEEGEEKELPTTITLCVSERQAIMLADLEINGKIHLAFVYRGSDDNTKAFLMKQDEVLEDLAAKESIDKPSPEGEVDNEEEDAIE
ncbi:Flp pilus assembly protein CpaB [Alkaliphilus pronyensis]|uniref:Flp pilus assembly protein CpaB n=2 Tax=Alkaliphilus pronyensis TaxID=1482732 RepID=A0A6I0FF80_9FIRM|nr:Flp pilus assembly protein CpaB [Alkaliphilus pronyensis]